MISYDQHMANQEVLTERGDALVGAFENNFWPQSTDFFSWSFVGFRNHHNGIILPDDQVAIYAVYHSGKPEDYLNDTSFVVPKAILSIEDEDEFRQASDALAAEYVRE